MPIGTMVFLVAIPLIIMSNPVSEHLITNYGAGAEEGRMNTEAIQRAIDTCAESGGGVVRVPKGTFLTGGLHLRSHLTLRLDAGAVLLGSSNCLDYGGTSDWKDALLRGEDLEDVHLVGEGTLDGADCRNPKGEEGFRGPHAVWLERSKNVTIEGITISRSANWAFNCNFCRDFKVDGLKVRGGHDGFDASNCHGFSFKNCDFRTGDDCLAGANNSDFSFEHCYFNTSCNAFRFACIGLTVRHSQFKGPGEFIHKISGRKNMLTAFVHFSPADRGFAGLVPHSDRWLIEDCVVDNADCLYEYSYPHGLWQDGQPVASVHFRNLAVTNLVDPIKVIGDEERQFKLQMDHCRLAFRPGTSDRPYLSLQQFGSVELNDVSLPPLGSGPVIRAESGNRFIHHDLKGGGSLEITKITNPGI
jgi:hypothetical protein